MVDLNFNTPAIRWQSSPTGIYYVYAYDDDWRYEFDPDARYVMISLLNEVLADETLGFRAQYDKLVAEFNRQYAAGKVKTFPVSGVLEW